MIRFWVPWIAYMGFIFWMSSRWRVPDFGGQPDYVLHAAGYGLLGLLALRAFGEGLGRRPSTLRIVLALGTSILYGISDEWHQSFVPGRVASFSDIAADAAGVGFSGLVMWILWAVIPKNVRNFKHSE